MTAVTYRDAVVDAVSRAAELAAQYLASYSHVTLQCGNCTVYVSTDTSRISVQCGNGRIIDVSADVDDVAAALRRMFDQPSERYSCYAMYMRGVIRHPLSVDGNRVCIDGIGCAVRQYANILFNLAERRVECIGDVDDDTL
jgi:hypothetical protein